MNLEDVRKLINDEITKAGLEPGVMTADVIAPGWKPVDIDTYDYILLIEAEHKIKSHYDDYSMIRIKIQNTMHMDRWRMGGAFNDKDGNRICILKQKKKNISNNILEERDRIMEHITDIGDRNVIICPYCGESLHADPGDYDYDDNPSICCPECDTEILAIAEKDFWYEQDQENFAMIYLQARGMAKLPGTTWNALSFYLMRFLAKRQEHCGELDIYPEYIAAYNTVKEYIDKPVIKEEEEKDAIQQV